MESAVALPARVFAEGLANGRPTPEAKAVASSVAAAGVPSACIVTETEMQFERTHLTSLALTDLAVGNPNFVRLALRQLRVPIPEPPDYPTCLGHPRTAQCIACVVFFFVILLTSEQRISSSATFSRARWATFLHSSTAIPPPIYLSNPPLKPRPSAANAFLVQRAPRICPA